MKKAFAILLSLLVLCGLLVGCGGSKPKDSGEKKGKTTITFWHVYSENFGAKIIADMIKDFNESHKDIEVKGVYNPDMYPGLMTNLQAEVASGSYPSICMIGYNYLNYFANNFKYADIAALDKDGWRTKTFLPNILTLAQTSDGKQLGIPMSISTPILYYNADLFKKAGIEKPPVTWAEVKKDAQIIKEKTGKYGFYMQEYADNWAVQGLLESNGARMMTNGSASFATKDSADAFQLLADMVKDKTALHVAADEGIAAFTSGDVGMLLGTSAKIGTTSKAASFDLKAAKFPSFDKKEVRIPAGGNFLAITAQSPEQQKAALEFVKFVMQPENLAKWSAGMGYLPPRQDVSEKLTKDLKSGTVAGLWQVAFSEMPNIYSWVSWPGNVGTYAEQLFANTRDSILSGNKAPMDALQNAQNDLNNRLGKK